MKIYYIFIDNDNNWWVFKSFQSNTHWIYGHRAHMCVCVSKCVSVRTKTLQQYLGSRSVGRMVLVARSIRHRSTLLRRTTIKNIFFFIYIVSLAPVTDKIDTHAVCVRVCSVQVESNHFERRQNIIEKFSYCVGCFVLQHVLVHLVPATLSYSFPKQRFSVLPFSTFARLGAERWQIYACELIANRTKRLPIIMLLTPKLKLLLDVGTTLYR